jgi:peptidyl-prolyl cis-trans isomerase SurA
MKKHFQLFALLCLSALTAMGSQIYPLLSASDSRTAATSATANNISSKDTTVARTDSAQAKAEAPIPESSVIDEVIWVVGDEPILKSDVEAMRMQALAEGTTWPGDPDCTIPEQLAVQKLFLHQAQIDSVEVSESDVASGIDQQISRWISIAGSQEKLEEYRKQTVKEMRSEMHDDFRDQLLIQKEKENLVKDIKVSPADVRTYFRNMPKDSLPYVPTEVEVQILVKAPRIKPEEIARVKNQLREFTDRVNKGETTFATLARLYSEDPVSARQGGEIDYVGRGQLDPAFANVAFNLTDPKKVSKIVESEYGFHIIQLIDKRGDKIKCRHILLKPKVAQDDIDKARLQLDSIANDIRAKKFTFDDAATFLSDDKDTKNNHGLMTNTSGDNITPRFQMKDLPTEVARAVDTMKVGEISAPFEMINSKGKDVVAIVKLKDRVPGHSATITGDFEVLKDVVLNKEREKTLHDWVVDKIKHTYVRMNDRYKNCNFEYEGWIK